MLLSAARNLLPASLRPSLRALATQSYTGPSASTSSNMTTAMSGQPLDKLVIDDHNKVRAGPQCGQLQGPRCCCCCCTAQSHVPAMLMLSTLLGPMAVSALLGVLVRSWVRERTAQEQHTGSRGLEGLGAVASGPCTSLHT